MNKKEMLVELSGQIINGMLSADSSLLVKIMDRSLLHESAARTTVDLAVRILDKIEKYVEGKTDENE